MFHWLHHLLNPHCDKCKQEAIEKLEQEEINIERNRSCKNCDSLERQLAIANRRIDELIEKLTKSENDNPPVTQYNGEKKLQTLQTRHLPFSVVRAKLEAQSRIAAEKKREEATARANAALPDADITRLEQTIGIADLEEIENAGNEQTVNS